MAAKNTGEGGIKQKQFKCNTPYTCIIWRPTTREGEEDEEVEGAELQDVHHHPTQGDLTVDR